MPELRIQQMLECDNDYWPDYFIDFEEVHKDMKLDESGIDISFVGNYLLLRAEELNKKVTLELHEDNTSHILVDDNIVNSFTSIKELHEFIELQE